MLTLLCFLLDGCSTRAKLVAFTHVGENVKAMQRMQRNNLQPKVMPYFKVSC